MADQTVTMRRAVEVVAIIAATWPTYPLSESSAAVYLVAIEDQAWQDVEAGMREAIRTRKFAPVPAELADLAHRAFLDRVAREHPIIGRGSDQPALMPPTAEETRAAQIKARYGDGGH